MQTTLLSQLHSSSIGKGRHRKLAQIKKGLRILENTGGFQAEVKPGGRSVQSKYRVDVTCPAGSHVPETPFVFKTTNVRSITEGVSSYGRTLISAAQETLRLASNSTLVRNDGMLCERKYKIPPFKIG